MQYNCAEHQLWYRRGLFGSGSRKTKISCYHNRTALLAQQMIKGGIGLREQRMNESNTIHAYARKNARAHIHTTVGRRIAIRTWDIERTDE